MNEEQKEHISNAIKAGYRLDGRKLDQFREITIETNCISTAEGSARVKAGETEVIAGVKLSVGNPFSDRPDEGVLMVGAELLPLSNPEFESGPPSVESIEVARVIDRGIREGKAMNTKKLCIEKGEKVWIVQADICPINTDGNLIDIGALAVLAALRTTVFPEYKDGVIDYKTPTKKKLELLSEPITVTVLKIGDNFVIDPTDEETQALDSRLTAAFLADGTLCAMQKGGEMALTIEDIETMLNLAEEKSRELRGILG
ncbi:MAG: RNA-binding protein [Nanoarchaeota archaeon]